MNILNFTKKPHLGLDLRPNHARFVSSLYRRKQAVLQHLGVLELPAELFQSGAIKGWGKLSELLAGYVIEHGLMTSTAAVALPDSLIKASRFNLPSGLSDALLEKEIALFAKREWGEMREAMVIDYVRLAGASNGGQTVYCVAVSEVYMSQLMSCFKACQLDLRVVETEAQALSRDVTQLLSPNQIDEYALAAGLALCEVPRW